MGTPLVSGVGQALEAALKCPHPSWKEEDRQRRGAFLIVLERCTACQFATRGKNRQAKEGDPA